MSDDVVVIEIEGDVLVVEAGGTGDVAPTVVAEAGPKGDPGVQGAPGPQGEVGPTGPAGADGADGAVGQAGPAGPAGADGAVGPAGPAGADGVVGPAGPTGPEGPAGPAGADGADSTVPGPAGADGEDGAPGAPGASAYELAVAAGFVGTQAEWLAALEGAQGPAGTDGADGAGVPTGGTTGQVLAKTSDVDLATGWVTPSGGTTGAMVFQGDWVSGTAYDLGDVVIYDGTAYVVTGVIDSPVVAPSASVPVTFDDDFSRANGPVGNGWTTNFGSAMPVISGGQLVPSSSMPGDIVRPLSTAGTVTATFTSVNVGNSTYIEFRSASPTSFLWAGRDGLRFFSTTLASWAPVAAGTVMEVEFTQTRIIVRGNGVELADIMNSANATATGVGVGVDGGGAVDDFHFASLTTGGWTRLALADADTAGATTGQALVYDSSTGWAPGEPAVTVPFTGSIAGDLAVVAGTGRLYNDTGRTLTIESVRASVGTPPTGSSLIVDVHKNGTTIFTTQADRPTVADGGTTSKTVPAVTSWADGEYLTVDVDQVGSTTPGADLIVLVVAR